MMIIPSARIRLGSLVSVDRSTPWALEKPCQSRWAGDHVVEAGQGVEAVPLVEVHGRLVAEPPVHLGGVVEVLGRERVELDCGGGRHGAPLGKVVVCST